MENLTGGTPPVRYLPCVVPCKLYFTIEQEESHLKNDENGEIKRLTNKQLQIEEALNKEFYIYITALEKERNALLFEDHSLKELQEMYQRREEYGKIQL